MAFTVQPDVAGWRVTNGALKFGPYSTQAKAQDAAWSLSQTYSRLEPAADNPVRRDAVRPRFRRRAD